MSGYFGLEQLAYDWIDTIEWIKNPNEGTQSPAEEKLLHALRERFRLEPITDPHIWLKELRREHRAKIVVDNEFPFWDDLST